MTKNLILALLTVALSVTALTLSAGGDDPAAEEKMVIALKTDDFDLAETDISHLAIGDAETIYTESGKTVDLLRTEDGLEIYVDGERLDIGMHGEHGVHESQHFVHKRYEVECETEEECEDIDIESLHGDGHHREVIIIKKKAETD